MLHYITMLFWTPYFIYTLAYNSVIERRTINKLLKEFDKVNLQRK